MDESILDNASLKNFPAELLRHHAISYGFVAAFRSDF